MLWPGCFLLLRAQAEAQRDLELLALRHEVAILCSQVRRPDVLATDRMVLAALGRRLPVGRLLFTPATIVSGTGNWSAGAGLRSDVDPVVVAGRSRRRYASCSSASPGRTRVGASAGFRVNSSSSVIGSPTRRSARSFAVLDWARRHGAQARPFDHYNQPGRIAPWASVLPSPKPSRIAA